MEVIYEDSNIYITRIDMIKFLCCHAQDQLSSCIEKELRYYWTKRFNKLILEIPKIGTLSQTEIESLMKPCSRRAHNLISFFFIYHLIHFVQFVHFIHFINFTNFIHFIEIWQFNGDTVSNISQFRLGLRRKTLLIQRNTVFGRDTDTFS